MSQAQRRRAAQKARAAKEPLPLRFAVSRETFEVLSSEWHDRSIGHYDGRTGNVDAKSGLPLFALASAPGFKNCRSELGRVERRGGTLTLARNRNAPMAPSMQRTERENERVRA